MKKEIYCFLFCLNFIFSSSFCYAETDSYADVVFEFIDSGVGSMAGPYGGTYPDGPGFPIPVNLNVVLGSDPGSTGFQDFLSLPEGTAITVGFINTSIVDGEGNDIFITEIGGNGERANVFISSDGVNFTFLGVAQDDLTTEFDLTSINYKDNVNAIKIVGLDNKGGSPGFDVVNIRALSGSVGNSTSTQRISILNSNLQLHIPELIYLTLEGEQENIWADLQLVPNQDGKILFEVTDFGFVQTAKTKSLVRKVKINGSP